MPAFTRATAHSGATQRSGVLASLRTTELVISKPILPAEIISTILDFLSVPDLLRFARVSRRMKEMVYDDTRWVQMLQSMGCWSETEARKRFEEAMRRKHEAQKAKHEEEARGKAAGLTSSSNRVPNSADGIRKTSVTLFDASDEEQRQNGSVGMKIRNSDGIDVLKPSPGIVIGDLMSSTSTVASLTILKSVRSIRGFARHEFGRIYGALAPLYFDLARSRNHTDPAIFRIYREPEHQAQMLAQLTVFARSDMYQGWHYREEKLNSMVGIFENAVLREFEQAYEAGDIDGKMRRYAHVLVILNGGQEGVDLFIHKHPIMFEKEKLGNSMDCINQAASGSISLEPSHEFFSRLSAAINEQSSIIDRVFPQTINVFLPFLERIGEDVISEYVTPLFDEAHERNVESYLKAIAGIFEQCLRFGRSLKPAMGSGDLFHEDVNRILARVFEPHVDLFLQEELYFFKKKSDAEVSSWERKIYDQDAATESFFMANINRQADKRDFLSSFKKVVMMPVNALPTIPLPSPFTVSKPAAPTPSTTGGASLEVPSGALSQVPTRSATPALDGPSAPESRPPSPGPAPTTELAAKAAIMSTKLKGIRSLFSIEVALNLVHTAKSSIERVALFAGLGGQTGEEAKEQCQMIFVLLLQTLGSRHIKTGFDKAVDHLSGYNPREASEHDQLGVAPLVMFLELVNVGDLILQMVDVFYEQEMVAKKLTDRNDFLDPSSKEKKRFEQMLDDRVAAGLNKGIDALMAEVDYICSTTQKPTDFNPGVSGSPNNQNHDIGPSQTAKQIVEVVSSHTKMLVGSTDKHVLDVFNQEVGLRLFTVLCKHLKRQRISVDGSITLISDMNHYFVYIETLRNQNLLLYFKALRELAQIYLIGPSDAKDMATIIADGDRFHGIFRAEEVYEFAERRTDWYQVKRDVERAMYGIGCGVM
ncbi:MAG: F-box protein: endocytic membrane traffic, recycling ReCYcling 1 [Geoglossum simile]|nr:MAG: F-box protein: endocytic membrane traffic, recycling ReCYcling 1 [Geoglossum simile]